MLEPQLRAGDVPRLILQHPAHHLAQVATGEGVVADKSDAVRGQIRATDGHDLVAHRWRHPGVDPVSDDVVELAEAGVQIHDVEMVEVNVRQSQLGGQRLSGGDWHSGQVDPGEAAAGKRERHRNQVGAVATPQLQHAARFHRRRAEPE